jgi:hypothetical protein
MKTIRCGGWKFGAGLLLLPALTHAEEQPTAVLTALSSTTLSGYVDTSAQWNFGTGNANLPNYAFGGSSKADGFNLNAIKLSLEKPVGRADAWGAGYKVDVFMGPDADLLNTLSAQALQSGGRNGDFAIRQAYVLLHVPVGNGLDFKLGVWDPITGYEVTDAPVDPNFTRSYGYTIEPVSHTGLQATYQFCEAFSATAGVADTYGPSINERAFVVTGYQKAESYKTYMAAVTLTAPTNWGFLGGSALSGCIINGFDSASPAVHTGANANSADQTSFYAGATLNTPVTGLKLGVAYDYAGVSGQPLTAGQSGYANAVGLYASYQVTEKLSLNARGEYASSDLQTTFLAHQVFETTATLQYDLWKNVLSRIEFRWDHAADGSSPFGGTSPGPASPTNPNGGDKANSYVLLADIAYKF